MATIKSTNLPNKVNPMTTVTSTYTIDVARPLTFRSAGEFSAYGLEGSSTVTLELEEDHSYASTEVSLEELDALISYLTAVRACL